MVDDREILQEPITAPRIGLVVSYLPIGNNKSHLFVVAGFIEAIAYSYTNFSAMLLIANDDNFLAKLSSTSDWNKKYTNKNYEASLKKLITEILGLEIAKNVTVKVVDNKSASLHKSKKLIDAYKPNILFYWGGLFRCPVLRRITYRHYPIGLCFFNIKNQVDKFADIYITRDINQKVLGPHDPQKCAYQPLVIKLFEEKHNYPADYVKKSADELIITTVIRGERLAETFKAYTKSRFDYLYNIFNVHKNVRWIFIGPNTPSEVISCDPRFSELVDQNRIEIIKFEEHLRAFFRHCDLYVHLPDIVGGAGGVAMARAESVATLCYIGSDSCDAQLPEAIYRDDKALFSAISFYINNESERLALGKNVREYMTTHCSSEAVSATMRDNIAMAMKNYMARQSSTIN